jgi:TPR repeat protein/Zn-dependent peptidase ImmA (M78 family)
VKTKLTLITLLVFNLCLVYGQSFQDVTKAESEEQINDICASLSLGFTSTPKEVSKIVDEIVNTAGVAKGGFELAQCSNINNAIAKMLTDENGDEVRYIIYDAAWLQSFNEGTLTDWSGKFVLAHEIGHHLNGHSLNNGSSNHKFELEADYFAGRALANLGATLDETLAVTEEMSLKETYSHPGRVDRAAQAKAGWKSIKNKSLTIMVKQEDVSEIAKEIVAMIEEKLSSTTTLTQEDFEKTIKQLQLVRGPKYYKGYTEDIRYLEAVTLSGMNEPEQAMDSYINYLSIEGLKEEKRIEQISKLFAESPSKSTAFFANPLVVFNLSKVYYNNKEYDNAISTGNQFLTRSEDEAKQSEVVKIIARSEFEKIENEMAELSPEESVKEAKIHILNLDYDSAADLLEPLVNSNNSEALYLLGNLYYNGTGVETDLNKAADLYAKAAQDNNVDAQLKLGLLYLNGVGVTKSLTNSRFWLEQAAANKHPSAPAALDNLKTEEKAANKAAAEEKKKAEEAKTVEEEKKPEEVPEVKTEGTDAEIIAISMTKANSYYDGGLYSDAFNNYLIAAKKGNPVAQERIGWMYFKGKGVKKDKDQGIEWWKKAAQKGNGAAISFLTRLGEW